MSELTLDCFIGLVLVIALINARDRVGLWVNAMLTLYFFHKKIIDKGSLKKMEFSIL